MRNVNSYSFSSSELSSGYSLTMRNVNCNRWGLSLLYAVWLFINYEECKYKYDTLTNTWTRRYSLTMRNVNIFSDKMHGVLTKLFINYEECK